MKIIDIIAGARPNFMKIAPIIRELKTYKDVGGQLDYRLVHTGQHYDASMSSNFFLQLGIPNPDINLEVGSGTQAEQTAAIMVRYERLLLESPCNLCLVVGDVTSTMACAISAQKLHIPVAHIEAGIRSGDWSMPEEVNRMVTDAITNYFFTTSEVANTNLQQAGISDERIFFVGNTMIDTLIANLSRLQRPDFWDEHALLRGNFFVLTLHRPDNVDRADDLAHLLSVIGKASRNLPVIFPVHPRTAKALHSLTNLPKNLCFVAPQPYLEFIYLIKYAKAVITDSGGITEESTVLNVPCMTLRETTERPETINIGSNELLGTDANAIYPAIDRLFANQWKESRIPPKWDGKTSKRIVRILKKIMC